MNAQHAYADTIGALLKQMSPDNIGPYTHHHCYSCHYSLIDNHDNWWQKTYCPNCNRSFVD